MNVDILGWLQTEKYWEECVDKVKTSFKFNKSFIEKIKLRYESLFKKDIIAISVRRGDFITNPNFFFLPLKYYIGALEKYFPEYKTYNIIFFSDDINYCKANIKSHSNIYFSNGLNDIEQLCLMSLCRHFIISNSTFSWWGARLGEENDSIIVRPAYFITGELAKQYDWKDYYPSRWIMFDHNNEIEQGAKLIRGKFFAFLVSNFFSALKFVKKIKHKMVRIFKN